MGEKSQTNNEKDNESQYTTTMTQYPNPHSITHSMITTGQLLHLKEKQNIKEDNESREITTHEEKKERERKRARAIQETKDSMISGSNNKRD